MRGLPSILSLFRNEFNKFNNTRARMLDSIYRMTNTLKSHFWRKKRYNFVMYAMLLWTQGFSLASAIGHSPKIVPDVRDFAVQFGQFVRDDFRKHTLYGYAQ